MLRRSEISALNLAEIKHVSGEGMVVTIRRSKTDNARIDKYVHYAKKDQALCPVRAVLAWMNIRESNGVGGGAFFCRIDRWDNVVGGDYARAVKREARLAPQSIGSLITAMCETVWDKLQPESAGLGAVPTAKEAADGTGEVEPRDADAAKGAKVNAMARRRQRRRWYSGHSMRRGGATSMIRAGKPWTEVSWHGRWRDGPRSFTAYVEEARGFGEQNPTADLL